MLYSVPQVASKLHISKQSLYSKIKLPLYSDKIITKHGQTYIDDDLVRLIKDNMKLTSKDDSKVDSEFTCADTTETEKATKKTVDSENNGVSLNQDLVNALLDQLKEKDLQFKEKDMQIHEKDLQIHELHKLIENNQILLKEKPQQDIQLLEEHFQDLDTKLTTIRMQMEEKGESPVNIPEEKHKGFFNLFKK